MWCSFCCSFVFPCLLFVVPFATKPWKYAATWEKTYEKQKSHNCCKGASGASVVETKSVLIGRSPSRLIRQNEIKWFGSIIYYMFFVSKSVYFFISFKFSFFFECPLLFFSCANMYYDFNCWFLFSDQLNHVETNLLQPAPPLSLVENKVETHKSNQIPSSNTKIFKDEGAAFGGYLLQRPKVQVLKTKLLWETSVEHWQRHLVKTTPE